MAADQLREIAAVLREKAAAYEAQKMTKCGQLLQAAGALALLQKKVRHVR